jgi:eukaryotic-like serine/threonine-protein kinase
MATCPTCREHYADDVPSCTKDGSTLVPDAVAASVDAPLQAGDLVGEYRIEAKIGEGGFGAVYRAVHPVIGKTAAVKVLHRQFSTNPQMVSRFISEAKAVNQIRHKNIIDIFAFGGLPDGRQFYVMELLEGASFEHTLRQRGRLPIQEALPILRSVGRALDAAHAAGIVHRDLKPENIFLLYDEDGVPTPKLLDFGIAKLLGDSEQFHKTRTGTPMGTPYYMSPEQAHGRSVDRRSDIYSFGVMMHQVLTGTLLFDGQSVMDVLFKHTNTAPPRLSEVCPDLPPSLDEPVLRMLAKEPSERPETVIEAIDALACAAHEAGLGVPLPSSRGAAGKTPTRRNGEPGVVITPARGIEREALAQAQTIAGIGPSFIAASSDIPQKHGKRNLAIGVATVVAALIGAALAVGFVMRHSGPAVAASQVLAPALPTVAPAPIETAAVTPSIAPPVTPTVAPSNGAATGAATEPVEIDLQIQSTPALVDVYRGIEKLGTSAAPIKLKRGEKVKLTFKAPGFAPTDVDLTPTQSTFLPVTLTKVKAGAPHSEVQW